MGGEFDPPEKRHRKRTEELIIIAFESDTNQRHALKQHLLG
jgi:hypothetical protein